ncbi:uncharacterized protein L3040_007336 [Drepanopeziza brunnea f. sp. 'multigermtubi']|uniref:uncharacterized protein n=1 Tax=Drepanopeziza brunnea f. sp. 'multigermtubi' TaxID=698441 RepID=UPI00238ED9AD|nr:hypothetical protein L3040_007336 [Drepanopeziza brunnea f. sp. 'multigermtubi']
MADEEGTREIGKEIEATDTEEDSGRGRTTGNYIGNLLPIRPLARQSTLAYGTLSALDDDRDDFLELRAADPHLKAKELALFARSFLKELKYSGPDDDFKTQLRIFANQASRYGLTSDDYLAAFSIMLTEEAITFYYNHVIKAKLLTFKANAIAVKDHFETDHRRQAKYDRWEDISLDLVRKENLRTSLSECFEKLAKELKGIQSSLRPAIAFATETSRPPAKARAYASSSEPHDHTCSYNTSEADSDLDEEYECFIQDRQYFGGKKAAKATTEEGFVTTHGTFDADEVYKQLEIQTAFYALTSKIETQNVPAGKAETYMASRYSENVFIGLMIDSGAANFSTASLP